MATRAFDDIEAGCRRERGAEFDVSDERGGYLAGLELVEPLEQAAKPGKPAARKRAAKPKPKE